jgi:hypothetical protein
MESRNWKLRKVWQLMIIQDVRNPESRMCIPGIVHPLGELTIQGGAP